MDSKKVWLLVFFRYKISTSNGGGYCDCGDAEAWSSNVHCATHEMGVATSQMDTNELIERLPPDIRIRTRHVFTAVLNYIHDMLTVETFLTLPSDLTYKVPAGLDLDPALNDFGSNDDYVTVVYNDEFHRFDEVIETIPRCAYQN
jgi:E3 ubiquitin-protein ligase UBR2